MLGKADRARLGDAQPRSDVDAIAHEVAVVVAWLMEQHGDAKLTDLLSTLADRAKARSMSVHDRCKAVYGQWLH